MYWWVNGLALVVMIGVLQLDSAYLTTLSEQTSHTQWQLASYIAIITTLILAVLGYWQRTKAQINTRQIDNTQSDLSQGSTPYNTVHKTPPQVKKTKSFFTSRIYQLTLLAIIFLAVLTHAIGQRLQLAEQSTDQTIYVEALVTPVALSDRQLQFDSPQFEQSSLANQNSKPDVIQGYRLLANLSSISAYDTTEQINSTSTQTITNPFADQSADQANTSLTHTASNASVLPERMTVLLTSYNAKYASLNHLAPNQQIRLRLALHPLKLPDSDDPAEFNEYRWLSTRHATATASILNSDMTNTALMPNPSWRTKLNLHRYQLRQHLQQLAQTDTYVASSAPNNNDDKAHINNQNIHTSQAMAVTLSLLTGDRSLISKQTTAVYRFAGISHLLAISGAHVLFLAILAAWLVTSLINLFIPRLYRHISRWQLQLIVAVVVAFIYALFAGFDVPAARTAWMLLFAGGARYLLLSRATFKVLLGLATFMAWQDIFVLWQAGFWLSFVAVILLIGYSYRQQHSENVATLTRKHNAYRQLRASFGSTTSKNTAWSEFKETSATGLLVTRTYRSLRYFILLQLWMTLALLPVSLWLFGEVSLWGIAVNMVAITLFGWIIVPLNLLAGMIYSLATLFGISSAITFADGIWQLLFKLLASFHYKLESLQLATNHTGWLYTTLSLPVLIIATLVVLPWLLPKGLLSRLLSLPALVLCTLVLSTQANTNVLLGLDTKSPSLVVTPLSLQAPYQTSYTLSATLLSTPDEHWLLLSDYPKTTGSALFSATASQSLSVSEQNEQAGYITQQLLKTLGQYGIGSVTGVIVQTPSPILANSVAQLNNSLSIEYYWQAGGDKVNSTTMNATTETNTGLIARPCKMGQNWQKADPTSASQPGTLLQITALTGWPEIDDATVWGCVVQVNSVYPVQLHTIQPTQAQVSNQQPLVDLSYSTDQIDSTGNRTALIFNSSQNERLWQLWQMLCPIDSPTASAISQHHWFTPSAAVLNPALVSQVDLLTLTTLDSSDATATVKQN